MFVIPKGEKGVTGLITCGSRFLSTAENNYVAVEMELLAIKNGHYTSGQNVKNNIKLLVSRCQECLKYLPSHPLELQIETNISRQFDSVIIESEKQKGQNSFIFIDRKSNGHSECPVKEMKMSLARIKKFKNCPIALRVWHSSPRFDDFSSVRWIFLESVREQNWQYNYNLEHGEKRILIFNQTKFRGYDAVPKDRKGVEQDTQAIKDIFNPLGFFIQEHEYLTVAQIKHELLSLSNLSGSWFIQTVCDEIGMSSPTDDLLSIMPRVIRNISINFTSCNEDPDSDPL
ncbi:unnamed protein product [Lepeophtheirus salmonis]|uniref:(salmon louse) hypothetical protein n=1 Tax=Lepeophtheirus salmonis TaxID=72036 RepID=A0A7R8CX54_LEPSM|nr:unnamed protein product [Lepeophtheirus salmonis]CAF2928390.1 unnamed protein product [Lepeophtheirus salmonis]